MRAHRRVAVGLERPDQRALGGQRPRRRCVVDRRDAATPRRSGWSRPGSPGRRRERAPSSGVPASPRPRRSQPGGGQHDGVVVAVARACAGGCRRCRAARPPRGRRAARAPGRPAAATTSPRARPRPAPRASPRRTARRAGRRAAGTAAMAMPAGQLRRARPWPNARRSRPCRRSSAASSSRTQRSLSEVASPRSPLVTTSTSSCSPPSSFRHLARLRQGQRAAARPDPHARRLRGRTLSAAGASGAVSAGGAGASRAPRRARRARAGPAGGRARSPSGGSSARAAAAA